jgi:energy-coupling factor transporter transmembrane protein EcfT
VTASSGQTICEETSTGFFAGLGFLIFVELGIVVLAIVATVKVITKAGYSGWWVLIGLVPIVGSIFFLIFAFSTWPVTTEVEMLRAQVAGPRTRQGPGGYGGGGSSGTGSGPLAPGPVAPTGTDPESIAMPSFAQFIGGGADTTKPSADDPATVPHPLREDPPPGWFPSPGGPPGRLRYWDGEHWTDHYH